MGWCACGMHRYRMVSEISHLLAHVIIRTLFINFSSLVHHDDVIKWKHFPRYWPFVRRIHRSPVNAPHKGQWRGALMFSLICVSINGWVHNHEAGDLRRYRAHYDVTVMQTCLVLPFHTKDLYTLPGLLLILQFKSNSMTKSMLDKCETSNL